MVIVCLYLHLEMNIGHDGMEVGCRQGGRSCASAQAALDEKFGLGRKF